MKKHQGSALTLPIKDIIGQADWTEGGNREMEKYKTQYILTLFAFVTVL